MKFLPKLGLRKIQRHCRPNRNSFRVMKLFVIVSSFSILFTGCCHFCPPKPCKPSINLILQDSQGHSVDQIVIGRTLNVGLRGLEPNRSYRVELTDDIGQLVSFYQLTSNRNGLIEPAPVWYHSGVVGCGGYREGSERSSGSGSGEETPVILAPRKQYTFRTLDEAHGVLANRTFYLTIRDLQGTVIGRYPLPIVRERDDSPPHFYFSNAQGCLMNSFIKNRDFVYLTGRNVPAGATIQIFLVTNQYGWRPDMRLRDVRREYQNKPHIIRLKENQTTFTEMLWQADLIQAGAYDAVVRINRQELTPKLFKDDIVTYTLDTGMMVQFLSYDPPWVPGVDFDIAGRMDKNTGYPYFEFHDVFEVGEEMWGAVDPAMVPASHPGGNYAAYYVIKHSTASSGLDDETEGLEIMPMKEWCINFSMIRIWNNPSLGEYDIVVDFGEGDDIFNVGTDFIDRSTNIGAFVLNDPSTSPGPFTTTPYSYEPATSPVSDPLRTDVSSYFNSPDYSVTETMDKVPLRGVGYYPNGTGPFPLVLIVHGNHNPTHASHTGYDYLCKLLAEHGIIAISIDENFLNGSVSGEMDARAIVLLRHLQRWREWNNTPGHTFYNKVNLNKIGLSGHSRGGEAITVTNLFNTSLHNASDSDHNFNFNIKSLFAIAPVDGQIGTGYAGTPIVVNNADYFIMHGSHDGDVFTFGGQKTYDRAFPNASMADGFKGLLFVHGAIHNYWNEEWASHPTNDGDFITSSLTQLNDTPQQDIGKVYVSAFFQLTLFDNESSKALKALMTGDVTFSSIPSGVTLVHQYSDKERIDLNNYEEDHNSSTGSYTGVSNAPSGLTPFIDDDITGTWSWSPCGLNNPYYIWNQTSGVIAGWNVTTSNYEINLPSTIGSLVNTYPYLSFRIGQIYENPASLNPAGANKDLSIQLELTSTPTPQPTHTLKVSNFDTLPYPVQTNWTHPYYCGGVSQNVTKSMMKTVRIPLRSFVVNKSDWDLIGVSKIKIKFNRSATGLVVIDDIQLTK